jgi:hypothetical protein
VDLAFSISPTPPVALAALAILLPALYLVARLSVVLPWAAVGGPTNARAAWSLTRGAGSSLVFIAVLATFAAFLGLLPLLILVRAFASLGSPFTELALPFSEALTFVVATVEVAALSLSFQRLRTLRAA